MRKIGGGGGRAEAKAEAEGGDWTFMRGSNGGFCHACG